VEEKLNGQSWPNRNHSFNNFQNELRTISSTSVRAGSHSADFLTHRLPSEGETRWSLNRRGRVQILRWHEFWRLLDFRSGVCEASISLAYDAMFLMFRTSQWSGNFGRRLRTDGASRSRRTEYFYICLKVATVGVQ